jgi:Rha family phage regulatory protein
MFEQDYGVIEHKGIPVVSSRKVAEVFEKRHDHVLDSIRDTMKKMENLSPDFSEFSFYHKFSEANFIYSDYKSRGKKYPEYLLTKDGFTYLAMGFNGTKAMHFKITYINQFNHMQSQLELRDQTRLDFPKLTDAIKQYTTDPKPYHYSNECNMINRIVLGVTAKEFKAMNNINPKQNAVRDYLSQEQIYLMKEMQAACIVMIRAGMEYAQRKQKLIEMRDQLLVQMGGVKHVQ